MKRPSILSESLHQRLNSYALAASAAGVSLMALALPAEARVVYTPAHIILGNDDVYYLDLNHDGIKDFQLANWLACTETCGWNTIYVVRHPRSGMNSVAAYGSWAWAYALQYGAVVESKRSFKFVGNLVRGSTGPWRKNMSSTSAYLGLKFSIKGKFHYGWARLSVEGSLGTDMATLTGYAYETVPNKAIITGKTKGPDVITVQPASLGHLARGAAALPTWRPVGGRRNPRPWRRS